MTVKDPDERLAELAAAAGLDLASVAIPGGAYSSAVRHGGMVYLSGQIPKVGNEVAYVGAVGAVVATQEGKQAARMCALRLLGAFKSNFGSLKQLEKVVRVNVFVQSSADFHRHSEVADGASQVLAEVLQCQEGHARTAVGVWTLPRNASVEVDMTVAIASAK